MSRSMEGVAGKLNEHAREMVRWAMSESGLTSAEVARLTGVGAHVLAERLQSEEVGMTMASFARMIDACGFEATITLRKKR